MCPQGGETLASAIFGGAMRSEVRTAGVPASATIQPFTHLQLDILPPPVTSLMDAFEFLTSAEDLEGESCGPALSAHSHEWSRVLGSYAMPSLLAWVSGEDCKAAPALLAQKNSAGLYRFYGLGMSWMWRSAVMRKIAKR